MAEGVYSLRDAEARLLDATSGTPLFTRIHFLDGTLEVPIRRPRSEEENVLNQDKADALMHSRVVSDKPIYERQEMNIDALVHSDRTLNDSLRAYSNPYDAATWTVGGISTYTTTSTLGNVDNAEGSAVACPSPIDAHRAAFRVDLEVLLTGRTTAFVQKWTGLFFDKIDLSIGNPAALKAHAEIWGVATTAASFTTATEIT